MSWDDEDFDIPTTAKDEPVMASWDDEFNAGDDEEPILDSWDAEEKPKPKAKPAAKKADPKKKKDASTKVLLEIDTLDEKTRKELLKKAELESDLNLSLIHI